AQRVDLALGVARAGDRIGQPVALLGAVPGALVGRALELGEPALRLAVRGLGLAVAALELDQTRAQLLDELLGFVGGGARLLRGGLLAAQRAPDLLDRRLARGLGDRDPALEIVDPVLQVLELSLGLAELVLGGLGALLQRRQLAARLGELALELGLAIDE